jgi:hypothetical protein
MRVEPRDVPPGWEGLGELEELGPRQEPARRGRASDGEMVRVAVKKRVLHVPIPLSRDDMRKGRHEQHKTDETAVS